MLLEPIELEVDLEELVPELSPPVGLAIASTQEVAIRVRRFVFAFLEHSIRIARTAELTLRMFDRATRSLRNTGVPLADQTSATLT